MLRPSARRLRLAMVLMAVAWAGCDKTQSCRPGTLFVSVGLEHYTQATLLAVDVTLSDGATSPHTSLTLGGSPDGSFEVDFAGVYPAGESATVDLTLYSGSTWLAQQSKIITLDPGCTAVTVDFSSGGAGGSGGVGGQGGRSGAAGTGGSATGGASGASGSGASGSGGMSGQAGGAGGLGGKGGSGGAAATGAGGTSGTTGTGGSGGAGAVGGSGGSATGGASGHQGAGGVAGSGSGGTGTGGVAGSGGTGTGGVAGSGGVAGGTGGGTAGTGGSSSSGTMTLTSPDQPEGALFGTTFTCNDMGLGKGINPELDWSDAPGGTLSYAITFIDTTQGASSALGQHWAIWNIPASVMQFPKGTTTLTGALAGASQTNKYLAPCPTSTDTYEFTLYALPVPMLNISGASGSGSSNTAGVAAVLKALGAIPGGTVLTTPLATATLHGQANKNGLD